MLGKLIVIIVGIAMIVGGYILYNKRRKIIKNGVITTGKIIDYQFVYDANNNSPRRDYLYLYSYKTSSGENRTAYESIHHRVRHPEKQVGKQYTIIYDKDCTTKFVRKYDWSKFFMIGSLIVFGIIYIGLGIFVID